MALHGLGRPGEGDNHLAEAEDLARRTGDCGRELGWFGPTNLRFWLPAIEADGGDPGKAVESHANRSRNCGLRQERRVTSRG
jgi:hypothetical protein